MVSGGRKNLRKQTLLGRLHDVRISYAYSCTDRPVDSGGHLPRRTDPCHLHYFVVTRFLKAKYLRSKRDGRARTVCRTGIDTEG